MPDPYLYTYKRSSFDNPSEVIFINQKEIAELDSFFSSHLDEVTKLFAEYQLQFIYLPSMLTPEFVKKLLDYHTPGLSDERCEAIMAQATPENVYQNFFDEEYCKNPYKLMAELDRFFSGMNPEASACPTNSNTWERAKYTGLVWTVDRHLAPPLTECANEDNDAEGYRKYHFAELSADSDDAVWEQLDHFFQYYFPFLYDFLHPEEIEFFSNRSFVSEDEDTTTLHNEDIIEEPVDEPNELILYNMSRLQKEPDETEEDQKSEQAQEISTIEKVRQAIRESGGHGITISRISKNSSIRLPLGADDKFPQEAYQLSQEIIERVEKLRKIGINELIIRSLVIESPKPSRLCITKDYRLFLPDYNNKEIVMGPLPKAVFLLFLRHPEGIMFKLMSEWKNELLGLYCRCSGRQPDEEMRQSVEKLTDPLSNSLNEKCSRIREAFLREMDDTIARNYYITGDRATPKRIQLDRELVEWGEE